MTTITIKKVYSTSKARLSLRLFSRQLEWRGINGRPSRFFQRVFDLTSEKNAYAIILFTWTICLVAPTAAFTQNENTLVEDSILNVATDRPFIWDMSFAFKTMNVFRGLLPSRAPAFSTQAGIKYGPVILGLYGGASFNGGYTETDLILIYYRPKWDVHLEWYYNFTEGITNIPTPSGFFDFDPETTRGLLDLIVHYRPSKNLDFTSSTFLFGRDRPSTPEDDANDILLRRGEQRYTQYLALAYNWYWGASKVGVHLGGSFSWNDFSGATFYGNRPGFNDIGVSFYRKLFETKTVSIPIKASVYINTVTNNMYLAATIQVIDISRIR